MRALRDRVIAAPGGVLAVILLLGLLELACGRSVDGVAPEAEPAEPHVAPCAEIARGSGFCLPARDFAGAIRTADEWNHEFGELDGACPDPADAPPVPEPGQVLYFRIDVGFGCGRGGFDCATRVDDTWELHWRDGNGGCGDCDAEWSNTDWILLEDLPIASYEVVPRSCGP